MKCDYEHCGNEADYYDEMGNPVCEECKNTDIDNWDTFEEDYEPI